MSQPPPPPPPPSPPGPPPARPSGNRRLVTWLVVGVVTAMVVVIGVAIVAGLWVKRYLADWFDTVEPPEASAKVGEWFSTDGGDLRVRVTSLECHPYDSEYASGPDDVECTFAFDAENHGDGAITLGDITVKSVVDGEWDSAELSDPEAGETGGYGSYTLAAGEKKSLTGSVTPRSGHLDGLAFDANDASSHSAVVVDAGDASPGG